MSNNRLPPKERTELMLDVALKLAAEHGLASITRNQIAKEAGVAPSLVTWRLGTMDNMRRSVMRRAVKTENLAVILQGIMIKDPYAMKASPDLRERAIASINGAPA